MMRNINNLNICITYNYKRMDSNAYDFAGYVHKELNNRIYYNNDKNHWMKRNSDINDETSVNIDETSIMKFEITREIYNIIDNLYNELGLEFKNKTFNIEICQKYLNYRTSFSKIKQISFINSVYKSLVILRANYSKFDEWDKVSMDIENLAL